MIKSLSVGAAVAAALLISPYFVGQAYQTEYHNVLDKLEKNPQISVTHRDIEVNWFDGKAITTLSINLGQGIEQQLVITSEDNLSFGPILFTNEGLTFSAVYFDSTIKLPEDIVDKETAALINDKLTIASLFDFSGNYVTDVNMEAFTFEQDDVAIEIDAFTSEMSVIDSKKMQGSFSWDGLKMTLPDASFVIDKVTGTFDQYVLEGDIYDAAAMLVGDGDIKVAKFDFTDLTSDAKVSVQGALVDTSTNMHDQLMDINIAYAFDKLVMPLGNYDNAKLALTLTNLDVPTLQSLSQQLNNLSEPETAQFQAEIEQLVPVAMKLLDNNPALKITDLSVENEHGKVTSDAVMTLNKDVIDIQNPMTLAAAAKMEANAKIPTLFLTSLGVQPEIIQNFVEQGFVTQTEKDLSVKALFEGGQLSLNGKPLQM